MYRRGHALLRVQINQVGCTTFPLRGTKPCSCTHRRASRTDLHSYLCRTGRIKTHAAHISQVVFSCCSPSQASACCSRQSKPRLRKRRGRLVLATTHGQVELFISVLDRRERSAPRCGRFSAGEVPGCPEPVRATRRGPARNRTPVTQPAARHFTDDANNNSLPDVIRRQRAVAFSGQGAVMFTAQHVYHADVMTSFAVAAQAVGG
jgi:hypothetical protein